MIALFRRARRWFNDQLVMADPDPQYSYLDRMDGLK